MDRQEWLKWRRIGSSDAPAIMQVSKWDTPYSLWFRKYHNVEREDNGAMKRGREMEEEARQAFESKMGVSVFATNKEHPKIQFMTASLDGLDMDEKVCVEIKCSGKEDHSYVLANKKVPEHYYPQVQHQLAVTGLSGMFYFSYSRDSSQVVEVPRDDKFIDSMISEEEKFWDCLLNGKAPELTEKDVIPKEDKEWALKAAQWISADEQLRALEKDKELLKHWFTSQSLNSNAQGAGIKLMRMSRKGAIDYSEIPELKGLDLEKYRKPATCYWQISSL